MDDPPSPSFASWTDPTFVKSSIHLLYHVDPYPCFKGHCWIPVMQTHAEPPPRCPSQASVERGPLVFSLEEFFPEASRWGKETRPRAEEENSRSQTWCLPVTVCRPLLLTIKAIAASAWTDPSFCL
ncbi:Hypothetical predicted protein [Marmota monax]|uniref:Uncharacterized protein n=1 Tax=Marmota monax TaxID=9995 RepID=A0A5E4BEZ0_MARMO|nr:Hypothetical predicted protein [Marmota monax]